SVSGYSFAAQGKSKRPFTTVQSGTPNGRRIGLYAACAAIESWGSGPAHIWNAQVHVCIVTIRKRQSRPKPKNMLRRLAGFRVCDAISERRKSRARSGTRSKHEAQKQNSNFRLSRWLFQSRPGRRVASHQQWLAKRVPLYVLHLHLTKRCSRRLAGLFPSLHMIKLLLQIAGRAPARRG